MAKVLRYLLLKRDLKFKGLKEKDKLYLHQHYDAILKIPRGKYRKQLTEIDKNSKKRKSENIDLYDCLEEYCRKTGKKDRQFLFHGVLLNFSIKEYYMLCSLLMLGEIDEQDFDSIDFRPNRCKEKNAKCPRNLEKSLADLKASMRKKIQKHCETEKTYFNMSLRNEFCFGIFNEAFENFAYIDSAVGRKIIKTNFKIAKKPSFM